MSGRKAGLLETAPQIQRRRRRERPHLRINDGACRKLARSVDTGDVMTIGEIGLGYMGLPLVVAFAEAGSGRHRRRR